MFIKTFVASFALLAICSMTILKMPRYISKPIMLIPSWLQSLILHFGYGGWIGGVTGHIMGAFLSIPWYFVSEMYLRPKILNIDAPKLNKIFEYEKKLKVAS